MKGVDKPLVQNDFAGQHAPLEALRAFMEETGLDSFERLPTDLKNRFLTLLLRVKRQTKVQDDEEKEQARLGIHERMARIWLTLHDEKRASDAFAAAGKEKAAAALLKESGDWEGRVELYRSTGEHDKAAQILESHGDLEGAVEAFSEAGDLVNEIRVLAQLGREDQVIAALGEMKPEDAEKLAGRYGVLDAWAKVLTDRQDWPSLARLYEAHGQVGIAGRAWEEAGQLKQALAAYRQVGDAEGHDRVLEKLVAQRMEKNDVLGAAQLLASSGKLERAADLAGEKHPEKAHRWYVEGGYLDKALELARREARRAEGHDDFEQRALWLERAGDNVSAATLLEGLGKIGRAQALYERAKAWSEAARCAEAQGKLDEAVELYYRANLPDEAERVKMLA